MQNFAARWAQVIRLHDAGHSVRWKGAGLLPPVLKTNYNQNTAGGFIDPSYGSQIFLNFAPQKNT
jgi:hypothetical protein